MLPFFQLLKLPISLGHSQELGDGQDNYSSYFLFSTTPCHDPGQILLFHAPIPGVSASSWPPGPGCGRSPRCRGRAGCQCEFVGRKKGDPFLGPDSKNQIRNTMNIEQHSPNVEHCSPTIEKLYQRPTTLKMLFKVLCLTFRLFSY